MATRTVAARGCAWCETCLYDGWGEGTDEEIRELGGRVVARFEELAQAAGVNAAWFPKLSEVHCDQGDPDADMDAFREQAFAEVWSALVEGEEAT